MRQVPHHFEPIAIPAGTPFRVVLHDVPRYADGTLLTVTVGLPGRRLNPVR